MPKPHQVHSAPKNAHTEPLSHVLIEICNRNFTVVTLINFLIMTTYYMIFITSTFYAQKTFALSLSNAGLTAGLMVIGCLIGRFMTGNLLSFFHYKKLLFAGLVFYILSICASFYIHSVNELYFQRLFSGMGMGIIATITGTLIAYIVPKQYHGLGISLFSMSTALSLALGPFFGILLLNYIEYLSIIKIDVIIIICCLLIFFLLKQIPYSVKHHRPFFELYSYIDPRVVRFSLVALLMCLSYGCNQAFITSYANERDLIHAASLFYLFYAFSAIATRPITGSLYDKRGENYIFVFIFIFTIISLCTLAFAKNSFTLLLAGVLFGIGFGNFHSLGQVVALTLVTKSRYPQATTTFFVLFDLGIGIAPYLFGFVIPHIGFTGMYLSLVGTVCCSALLYYFVHGEKVRNNR